MKFSIVVTCRNITQNIRISLESVLRQTCSDYEVLVLDQSSSDQIGAVIREFLPDFKGRICYETLQIKDYFSALNYGLQKCQGEMICFLEAGCRLEADCLAKVSSAGHGEKNAALYYGMASVLNQKGEEIMLSRPAFDVPTVNIPLATCFFDRSYILNYGMFDEKYRRAADYDLQLKIYQNGDDVQPVDFIAVIPFEVISQQAKISLRWERSLLRKKYGYSSLYRAAMKMVTHWIFVKICG